MRIAQINAVYDIMSTGRTCRELSDYLKAHGHECLTFYGNHHGDYPDTVFLGSDFSHKLHAAQSRLTGNAGKGSYFATKKLLKRLDEYKPDVVHLRNLHGNFVHIPMLLKYLAKKDIPTVVHLHDCFFFTGGCMHYTVNQCYKWKEGNCKDCKFLKFGKNYWLRNNAKKNLQEKIKLFQAIPRLAVVGVSKWTEEQARQSPAFKNAKVITHVYNWIDLDIFRPISDNEKIEFKKEKRLDGKKILLGVASGWGESKGLKDFIQLSNLIPSNYLILLIGTMPNDITLPKNIRNIRAINNSTELSFYYNIASVFVHLSREETFGKVIAESLACGCPAIVYDSTALPELIGENYGMVIESGNIDKISRKLEQLNNIDLNSIRAYAINSFSLNNNCEKQLVLYKNILGYGTN